MTQEELIKLIKDNGKLLPTDNTVYTHFSKKVEVKCIKCGSISYKLIGNIRKGKGCRNCSLKILSYEECLKRVKKKCNELKLELVSLEHTYEKGRGNDTRKVHLHCKKHNFTFTTSFHRLTVQNCTCKYCGLDKINNIKQSRYERAILEYIKSIYKGTIKTNIYGIIGSYELDIYLPELKLAFEYNGILWHNYERLKSRGKNPKTFHQRKSELCDERGISLIHIWEDEDYEIIKRVIYSYITRNVELPDISNPIDRDKYPINYMKSLGYCISDIKESIPVKRNIRNSKLYSNICYGSGTYRAYIPEELE